MPNSECKVVEGNLKQVGSVMRNEQGCFEMCIKGSQPINERARQNFLQSSEMQGVCGDRRVD